MKKFLISAFLFLYAGVALAVVDLNSATQADLEKVNGIGPKKAQAIVLYRTQNGSFKSVEDLQKVRGIGKGKVFEKVKGEFTVGGASATTTTTTEVKPGLAMKALNSTPAPAAHTTSTTATTKK
ncbi:MAG: helix-hairpin-helix domain-containing protein [Pseudomonadota bacterium]